MEAAESDFGKQMRHSIQISSRKILSQKLVEVHQQIENEPAPIDFRLSKFSILWGRKDGSDKAKEL